MRTSAALILLALLCVSAAAAPVPPADSFRAFHRFGDDNILVTWRSPDTQPKGREFVLEIARREADFAADNDVKSVTVKHLPPALVSGAPQYFPATKDNALCYVRLTPADLFPPPRPAEIPWPERVKKMGADNELTSVQWKRIQSSLENADKADNRLSEEALAYRNWSRRFQAETAEKDEQAFNGVRRRVNFRMYYFRLAELEGGVKSYVSDGGKPILIASTVAKPEPAPLPPADSFRAFDCPNDDGSSVLVVWAQPDNEPKGEVFVLEVARREADFATDNGVRSLPVKNTPKSRASSKSMYFGRSPENKRLYFVQVMPANLFPPPEAEEVAAPERLERLPDGLMSGDRLRRLRTTVENADLIDNELTKTWADDRQWLGNVQSCLTKLDDNVITPADFRRALTVLDYSARPDNELVGTKLAGRRWLQRLESFMERKDEGLVKDRRRKINGRTYYFRLAAIDGATKKYLSGNGKPVVVSATAVPDLFNFSKLNTLILSLAFSAVVVAFIYIAKRRAGLFIRRISGLDAIDEAIGRATETNRPVFFIHGLGGVADMSTIASVNILSEVARRTAEHDSRIRVMNNDALVTAVSLEVVRQAYSTAGRPDAFNPDDVSLVASEQFAYVAAVGGAMVREKPGANFLMGSFFAESLLLAETGASTGAIQVAGTDSYTQIPFFITTCDYTLIGEELYAAGAYLSREPRQLGSLRGQDAGKAFLMIIIVVVSLAATAAVLFHTDASWLRDIFKAVQ